VRKDIILPIVIDKFKMKQADIIANYDQSSPLDMLTYLRVSLRSNHYAGMGELIKPFNLKMISQFVV
jgi:hypothetical protein